MLVSYNWLKNYVDLGEITPEQLAEKITKSGIEVDHITYVAEKSTNVVVGYVASCEKHPDADKLNLCQVDVGEETLQIVCGAPNVAKGQKVAVALPGAVLPGGIKIKKVKLRGVESNGMICSLKELGLDPEYIPADVAEGIFIFPEDTVVGESVTSLLNLDDAVLEFDLTPNRADALSMLGVAYEVAAILDQPIKLPDEALKIESKESAHDFIAVEVEAEDLNPYYGAFLIKDVEIKASPLWMRNYLMAAGIRPINNVVDITNYVLLEYGQPLHAFDYERFASDKIVVRRAVDGEKITTLDDQVRTLAADTLVITNGKEATAIAGVMGGANSEVVEETKTVLLEAAYFNGTSIRKTVKTTGLRSEASTRYEKGIDPNRVKRAGIRACQLLQKYAGGTVLADVVEFDALDRSEKIVEVNTARVNERLGTEIDSPTIAAILNRLDFTFEQAGDDFTVHVPTRRGDITIFEDMLEEIARIYGYDHLPFTLPVGVAQSGGLTGRQALKRQVKNYLQSAGLMETMTYSLTNEADSNKLISPEVREQNPQAISLAMPMSEDHKYLRLSILPELLHSLTYNQARNQANLAFYEVGNVFISEEETLTKQPTELLRASGAVTGKWVEHPWQQEMKDVDFFVVKGIIEGLFDFLQIPVTFSPAKLTDMHPGRTAILKVDGNVVGFIGQLHPSLEKTLDLKATYVFDVNLDVLIKKYDTEPTFTAIPKYPSIERDIAFILDDHVHAGDVQELIKEVGAPLVKQVEIFDVYQGENVEDGKKSIAYSLLYQHPEKTLKDDEVEASYQQVVEAVNKAFNAYVRS
ncbi:phenylalanine--tRNA ligase subunit beta [Oceanobacillus sp. 143]|uniref:Phenylalanine--tRNA ligase beta subunit n=1 Tax=Oceanobacillus zhaokaii TaxID=2052660 RepID=A0A345PI07_9BACI|nr:phenylalanine--tRNA ligase subunit beta [Oceanobacillus zhaokaii]AXI09637.1 phenylalanine--tRNA ligase subunit beta [Oceanobacillus zhaokaii]QGS68986.1 phenylalanine--tRNA ligase subunit beta [Oceanobacillus sp. 143]